MHIWVHVQLLATCIQKTKSESMVPGLLCMGWGCRQDDPVAGQIGDMNVMVAASPRNLSVHWHRFRYWLKWKLCIYMYSHVEIKIKLENPNYTSKAGCSRTNKRNKWFPLYQLYKTSNGSWCIGIKGEMSGTVCVTFTWDMYIYMSCL